MMLAATRRSKIVDLVQEQRSVRTEEIARTLGVSVETIRRDLEHLDLGGDLVRVHGGAVLADLAGISEPAFATREGLAAEAKTVIGRAAAALMESAHTIYLDIGTTAASAARQVPGDLNATVITSSMRVAEILAVHPTLTVLIVGGVVRRGDLAVSGSTAVDLLRDIHPDVAFVGSGGVALEQGLTDFEMAEVPLKRMVLRNSKRTFVLADSTKIGRVAPYRVSDLAEATGVITDPDISDAERERLEAADVKVVIG